MNKIRLIAIAKNEAAYLAEWVHHHLHFGFDQIAVILNGCTDNSRALLERIAQQEPRLLVRDGDGLKATCEINVQDFQISAYAQELALARQDSNITHVMCLDIDEFWVTPRLQNSIHTYINSYPQADSIAFTWHMEVPNKPEPFSPALQNQYPVQKDRHVKSLHRVTERLTYLDIHNAIHMNGQYLLADGRVFPQYTHNGSERAGLPDGLFRPDTIDSAFVYHRVFRSQEEYIASLQRGRPGLSTHSLKSNRWGYQSQDASAPILDVQHPETELQALHSSRQQFIETHSIESENEQGRKYAQQRFKSTIAAIANGTVEAQQLTYLFRGITLAEVMALQSMLAHITHHFDNVTSTHGGLIIEGWVIDKNSERSVNLDLPVQFQTSITRLPRPDVTRQYPGTDANSGFRIEIQDKSYETLELIFRCGHASQSHKVPRPF